MTVAVGIDPDDGICHLCQHGHAACLLPGCGRRRTGLGGVTGGRSVMGHAHGGQASDQGNTVGQAGADGTGDKWLFMIEGVVGA
jgi:hypothetical protein